jgi:hypothetical protein
MILNKKIYIQIFCLVSNTATVIGWLTTAEYIWFGKHELRQVKHLMGDLGHHHIFTTMLASADQFKIYPFQLVVIFY